VVSFDNADQATLSGVRGRLAGRDWGFIATSGFVLACLLGFPGRDEDNERRYSWEVDDD
jgi:hypothetical protein